MEHNKKTLSNSDLQKLNNLTGKIKNIYIGIDYNNSMTLNCPYRDELRSKTFKHADRHLEAS